nr:hypothetical protein [Tanacetum cinerariifolium]
MDILKHTNFFRAFTASLTIPSIFIQQFWDTVRYEKIIGCYKCQLDEHRFDLTKDTLRDALHITPVDNNNAFSSPLTLDALINFVNDLGLTRNTSRFERPRTPVLQILWGVVNQAHIDCVERIWEEFTKSIHTFIKDKKNLTQHTQGKKKATLIVIPSVRFTKLIIYHLQSKHKFHPRPNSPLLGYLEFNAKGTKQEVFEMPILNELITADIQEEQYYKEYMEKLAKHQRYLVGKEGSDLESPTPKPAKATKNSKPSAHKANLRLPKTRLWEISTASRGSWKGKEKRRTPASTEPLGHNKSSSIYSALGLTDSASEFDKEVPLVVNVKAQDEGHAGPNLGVPTEGQAGSDLGNDANPQPQSIPVVHAGPNLKHMDLEATDPPPPPPPPAGPSGTLRSFRASGSSQVLPLPPPPPSTNQEGLSHGSTAPSSSKTVASAKYTAWTTTDTRLRLFVSLIPKDLHMDDDMALDTQSRSFDDDDIRYAHIPKVDLQQDWWKPLKEDRLATPEPACVDESIIRHNVSKPLPLGGPPGKVIIQSEFFFNKDLEYMIYDSKGSKHALSILKIKVTYYPNVGLEQMVPDQMWIEEECKHTSEGDRRAVRTHMLILSVVRIEVFSMYGSPKPSTTQRQEDSYYCSQLIDQTLGYQTTRKRLITGDGSYQTQLNLTKPRWDATGFVYKHGFMIDEALDYRVKEFKVNRMNPGLNTRFLTRKDMDRSKEFMFAIQRRLKTRRIFRNLESFVGGRVREGDYRLL